MRARSRVLLSAAFVALVAGRGIGQTPAPVNLPQQCTSLLHDAYTNYDANRARTGSRNVISSAVDLREANTSACVQSYARQNLTNAATAGILLPKDISAARTNLLTAIANYSPQQQQGATTSSTSATNPISKLTGFSSIAEEFAGVNVSSTSSSMTFSLSGRSLFEDLVQDGVWLPCSQLLGVDNHCISKGWYKFASSLTPSITASTSSAIKGTANSTATPTPVTLSTPGSTWPSFGGFGLKEVAWYHSKSTGDGKSNTVSALMQSSLNVANISCPDYETSLTAIVTTMSQQTNETAFVNTYSEQLPNLEKQLNVCLQGNTKSAQAFHTWMAEQVISTVADVDASTTPALGFEYDLSTPLNQPSYSTTKANFSWQFGKPPATPTASMASKATAAVTAPSSAATKGSAPGVISKKGTSTAQEVENWAKEVYDTIANPANKSAGASENNGSASAATATNSAHGAGSNSKGASVSTNKTASSLATKAAAGSQTPPLTINLMVDGEFYNSEPPSSVPSARRLRDVQLGFEADYIIRGSKSHWLTNFIGDSTASLSYLYQDQTSASIVTAPPSGISFSNLPSTASTVYTSRGPINLGQVRWGLGTGSNLSFPIAFTYSNRSALIAHPIKGLQFGLSYNLSTLFSSNSGSSK